MLLFTNRETYYNDLSEVIRLFTAAPQIVLNPSGDETGDALTVLILDTNGYCARAEFRSARGSFVYEYAFDATKTDESASREAFLENKRLEKRTMKIAAFRAMRQAFPDASLPWGSLTGIRPTSLLRELTNRIGEANAERMLIGQFDVSQPKLLLAERINASQRGVLASIAPRDIDIYIGIPFCRTRCLYCSFASELRTKKTDMGAYLDALKKDIALNAELVASLGLNVRAVYLGGGTPTVLTEAELDALLDHAAERFALSPKTELTVEAGRPDTITKEKLIILKKNGVSRISINPQTMLNKTLALVGRDHTADDIIRCFYEAREVGFDSINTDLIAGLPGENADDFSRTLERVACLSPDCLTVHTLAIKRSSRLHERLQNYDLPPVSEVEKMVALGEECALDLGMLPYYMYRQKYMAGNMENVGYSLPDKICLYNIDMMEDALSILASGAGAMTKRVFEGEKRIERIPNPKDIATYIEKIERTHSERLRLFTGS